jgi:hypothetical protein
LLAAFACVWLFAAAAPCVMAQPAACPQDTMGNPCPHDNPSALSAPDGCDALTALNCQLPDPNPPSAALDIPAPAPMLLHTLPLLPEVSRSDLLLNFVRAGIDPPSPLLNRKQSRLLI